MKHLALILLACLLALSACQLASPSQSPTQPGNFFGTVAAETASAQPSANATTLSNFPTVESTVTEGVETSTPTFTPTITPTPELPSPTPVMATSTYVTASGPVYPAPSQAPEQFIAYYFANINISNYPVTWSLLTDRFIASNNPPSSGGYQGYVNFWNTVHEVKVLSTSITSQNGGYATVRVEALYHYNAGTIIDTTTAYSLIFNYSRGTWMFNSPSYLGYVPPASQTPGQFIYYYFANINISNFPLTWSLLTANFIAAHNPPSSGGYQGYVNFWNTVRDVQVLSTTVTAQSGGFAVVDVYALYNYNSGTSIYNTQTYQLTYDYSTGTWLFDEP